MLRDMMRRRKTLVVLDDVDCIDQLEALAGEPNWFKSGSRIIITTRDEQVLTAHQVKFVHDVNLLSPTEAICLFNMHAFPIELLIDGFKKLSEQVLCYASGLPLTIKVLGSFLCGKNEDEWEDTIQRLETIPLKETMQILELSYNDLDGDHKDIFLDVACILKGWDKEDAIRVLESRGFHAKIGLRVLEQKSLITYNEYGELGMHDHLQEMGRNIVRRSHPDEPQRHSRLWVKEEIGDILTNDLGTQATKCLYFQSPEGFSAEIALKGLAKMKDLRFIHIKDYEYYYQSNVVQFDKVSEYLPNSLRFMRWDGIPISSLPNTFQGKYLVGIDISWGNIVQLWEDGEEKVLHKLRFLTIMSSKLRTFDLKVAPNLEQLTIKYCVNFEELHMPVESVKLEYLNLSYSKLKTLYLGSTPNLKRLTLKKIDDLVELQMPAESPKLEEVNISHLKLKTLYLGSTPNLKRLTLKKSDDLVELQMPAESPKLEEVNISHLKLKTLYLGSTPNLKRLTLKESDDLVELQMPAESPKLEEVNISHSKLKTLYLGSTPNLKRLTLEESDDLVELQMPAESPKLEEVNISHSKLKTLYLGSTPNLKRLTLEESDDLVELQMPAESPKLEEVNISHSKLKTFYLGSTPNLKRLTLEESDDLVELQMPAESPKLEEVNISHSKLKTLYLGSTPNLKRLTLEESDDLVELPMPAESPKLEEVNISHSKLKTLDLGLTPNLEQLHLANCYDLVEINAPIGCLKNLLVLELRFCGRFKSFVFDKWSQPVLVSLSELHLIAEPTDVCLLHPDNDSPKFRFECYYKEDPASSFGNLERLISIGLCACINLESFSRSICRSLQCLRKLKLEGSISKAPKDLGRLECLEELTFSSTEIKNLSDSICMLKHLKSLKLKSCLLLEKLPDDLGRLESLETLILTDCKLLQYIPNSICKMKCINNLRLRGCIRVVELPEDIGCLEGLKELDIVGTGITRLPQSIFRLRGLRIVGSIRLIDTYGLLLKRQRTDADDIFYYLFPSNYDETVYCI